MSYLQNLKFYYRAWRYRLKLEGKEILFMTNTLSPGDTAVDIGAHKGAYTYWMQKAVGRRGKVFSFEPQPSLAVYLESIITSLKLNQVKVENLGISSKAGSAELYVPGINPSPGATFAVPAENFEGTTLRVNIESLDDYFDKTKGRPIHLIKVDVEGHELKVFQGAERILKEDRPVLIFECENRHHTHDSMHDVFTFLEELGFKGGFYSGNRFYPFSLFNETEHQKSGHPGYVNNFIFKYGTLPSD